MPRDRHRLPREPLRGLAFALQGTDALIANISSQGSLLHICLPPPLSLGHPHACLAALACPLPQSRALQGPQSLTLTAPGFQTLRSRLSRQALSLDPSLPLA